MADHMAWDKMVVYCLLWLHKVQHCCWMDDGIHVADGIEAAADEQMMVVVWKSLKDVLVAAVQSKEEAQHSKGAVTAAVVVVVVVEPMMRTSDFVVRPAALCTYLCFVFSLCSTQNYSFCDNYIF